MFDKLDDMLIHYEELMLSYPVLNLVIDKLHLDMTPDNLKGLYSLKAIISPPIGM